MLRDSFQVLGRADVVAFKRVAGWHAPVLDRLLPRLSRAADHSKLTLGIAAALFRLGGRTGERAAMRGLASVVLTSIVVNLVLKPLFRRARPALESVPAARRLARVPKSASLPSGHTASATAFAAGAATELPALAAPLGALAAAVGFSRVYTGVHYPSDVLLGGGVGLGVALLLRARWPSEQRGDRLERGLV